MRARKWEALSFIRPVSIQLSALFSRKNKNKDLKLSSYMNSFNKTLLNFFPLKKLRRLKRNSFRFGAVSNPKTSTIHDYSSGWWTKDKNEFKKFLTRFLVSYLFLCPSLPFFFCFMFSSQRSNISSSSSFLSKSN